MKSRRSPSLAASRRPLPLCPSGGSVRPAGAVGMLWIPPAGVAQERLTRPEVAMFQQVLIALGYTDNGRMRVDGVAREVTARAVHAFQTDMQPARIRAEAGDFGDRVRAFLAATAPLRVDGDLGPETQRWLRWFALPADQGGAGGEGASYDHVPVAVGVTGLTPARVVRAGGRTIAPEVSAGAPLALFGTSPVLRLPATAPAPPAPPPAPAPPSPPPGSTAAPPVPTPLPATPSPLAPVPVPTPVPASPQPLTAASAASGSRTALVVVGVVAVAGLGAWAIARPTDRSHRENPRRSRRGR